MNLKVPIEAMGEARRQFSLAWFLAVVVLASAAIGLAVILIQQIRSALNPQQPPSPAADQDTLK
jgi:putative copper export protein